MYKVTRRADGIYQKAITQDSFEDALRQEVAARQAADSSLEDLLAKEAQDREGADIALASKIAQVESKIGTSTGGGTLSPDVAATIQTLVADVAGIKGKAFIIPFEEVTNDGQDPSNKIALTSTSYVLHHKGPGQVFAGKVDVLTEAGDKPFVGPDGLEITATVDSTGRVTLSRAPNAVVRLTYAATVPFSDLPSGFLKTKFPSPLDKDVSALNDITKLKDDMRAEKLTPTGLYAQATGGTVYLTFTYQDSPELSHFILERYNPATGQWEPYDGNQGIVTK